MTAYRTNARPPAIPSKETPLHRLPFLAMMMVPGVVAFQWGAQAQTVWGIPGHMLQGTLCVLGYCVAGLIAVCAVGGALGMGDSGYKRKEPNQRCITALGFDLDVWTDVHDRLGVLLVMWWPLSLALGLLVMVLRALLFVPWRGARLLWHGLRKLTGWIRYGDREEG